MKILIFSFERKIIWETKNTQFIFWKDNFKFPIQTKHSQIGFLRLSQNGWPHLRIKVQASSRVGGTVATSIGPYWWGGYQPLIFFSFYYSTIFSIFIFINMPSPFYKKNELIARAEKYNLFGELSTV